MSRATCDPIRAFQKLLEIFQNVSRNFSNSCSEAALLAHFSHEYFWCSRFCEFHSNFSCPNFAFTICSSCALFCFTFCFISIYSFNNVLLANKKVSLLVLLGLKLLAFK